jgi:ADP-dependent NAD(P)H-hydrate dehydratase / NAD(P)H-hydrate epimerase
MKIVTVQEMRALDRRAIRGLGIPAVCLMENAGRLVAEEVQNVLRRRQGRKVCVVCGPGNNGGDGLVAARYLRNAGIPVKVLLAGNTTHMTPETSLNLKIARKLKIPVRNALPFSPKVLKNEFVKADVIVDALFGVGLSRDIEGKYRVLIEAINAARTFVIAVDISSGLDGTTGRVWGVAVKASMTVTLACAKKGLFVSEGPAHAGRVVVVDIGIPQRLLRAR